MFVRRWRVSQLVTVAALSMVAVALPVAESPAYGASSSKSPITIGYVTSETGIASSSFADGAAGALARIKQQNAEGGVNGHKLVLVVKDDQSSPGQNLTAAQELVQQDNAFGVIDISAFTYGAIKFLNQEGVPVTGEGIDGPEWGEQPYSNMFSFTGPSYTEFDGKYYTYSDIGTFMKSIGVTKLASLAYGISSSSVVSANGTLAAANAVGIKTCYQNNSVPFGGVDFTADVLVIKSSGCNGVYAPFVDSSDVALSQALKQGGVSAQRFFYSGYSQSVLQDAGAKAAYADDYAATSINFVKPNSAVQSMEHALAKSDSTYHVGDIPDVGLWGSYVATDLMIKGLEQAGSQPTRASFISNLRKVSSYDGNGILSASVTFKGFGTVAMVPTTDCSYIVQLKGNAFVLANGGKPICGHRIAFTSSS